jgi:hypothetical protein
MTLNPNQQTTLDEELDVFGQQPGLSNLYTQITSIFRLHDEAPKSKQKIIDILRSGLQSLADNFPWTAGQVLLIDGIYRIQSLEPTPRLVIQDSSEKQSLEMLEASQFPFSLLDESFLSARPTLSFAIRSGADIASDPSSPIFLVQATFIKGGLLLTFVAQHNVLDMTSQSQLMVWLDKACRGEGFSEEEIKNGNPVGDERKMVIPMLDERKGEVVSEEVESRIAILPPPPANTGSMPPPKCKWAYFLFPSSSLKALKELAASTIPSNAKSHISTDDALSAFIWQRITHARLQTHLASISKGDPSLSSTFARAVDPRRHLSSSYPPLAHYPGIVQNMTFHTFPLTDVSSLPLGVVASNLRAALTLPANDTNSVAYRTRSLATLLSRTPLEERYKINVTASLYLDRDIMLSSWMGISLPKLTFGLDLGEPVAVRRPCFTPVEGLCYILPKGRDGEVCVGVCIREEAVEFMKGDEELTKWAKYVG